ncbi:MAG: hypothetical protein J6Y02_01050 [Pseudobutyrivibrio sp.]|nr:hypothetical protein [Pseudobutyrivibrio sp.]
MTKDEKIQEAYKYLAFKIVRQAVKDYKKLNRVGRHTSRLVTYEKLEEFFLSEYFESLCSIDGSAILRDLRKERK